MKMYQILECKKFYNDIKEKKIPIKTAYKLNKLLNKLEEEALFYQEKMTDLIREYGMVDENGDYLLTSDQQGVRIKPDKVQECEEKIRELSNLEIDTIDIKFTLEELDFFELSIAEMKWLMPFIEV